jgi:transcriptional regulator GlxA family with amidase domain
VTTTQQKVFVLVLPGVHAMDLAGPVQVLYEANGFGGSYELHFVGADSRVETAQGFCISELEPLPEVTSHDWVLVPGIESTQLDQMEGVPVAWLREARDAGARICSICSAAWVLAHAGLLDHRRCTTHWKITERLKAAFPAADVRRDRLFVRDGQLWTSAGETSGIDMALSMVEEDHGAVTVAQVAREMVVYYRRDGSSPQSSIYVQYRTHLHPGVHKVQDWLMAHPERRHTLEDLAAVACMSPRNLTRVFRRSTGVTLKEFTTRLRLEIAGNLLRDPGETVESVASQCGFADARQLRRLWKSSFGVSPSNWRPQQVSGLPSEQTGRAALERGIRP